MALANMKFLFALLATLSLSNYSLARDIDNWDESLSISEDFTFERLWEDTAGEYFYGDDGIECDGEIHSVVLVEGNTENIKLSYQAQQAEEPLCIWLPFYCEAEYEIVDNGENLSLEYLNCQFDPEDEES